MRHYDPKHYKGVGKRKRFPVGACLVYLLLLCTLFAGVSFSRYTTTAAGGDSARVARFSVSAAADSSNPTEIALSAENPSGTYKFIVTNDSEVLVKYSVQVSGVPDGVTVKLNEGNAETPTDGALTLTGEKITFDGTKDVELTFALAENVTENVDLTKVTVNVLVEQVD